MKFIFACLNLRIEKKTALFRIYKRQTGRYPRTNTRIVSFKNEKKIKKKREERGIRNETKEKPEIKDGNHVWTVTSCFDSIFPSTLIVLLKRLQL